VKTLLIINPKAGIQKKKLGELKEKLFLEEENQLEREIKTFFEKHKLHLDIKRTKKAGDATRIAKTSKDYDAIIAAGGDGTVNEVINGLENYETKIGIIPLGSENVMAKELKIPLKVKRACEIIIKGKTKDVDVGLANKKKFLFVSGIGFDANAITNVQPKIKQILGKHSYAVAALKTLFEHNPEELIITINKKEVVKGYFVIISNTKRYGGKLMLTPDAELDDGFLDLCVFKNKDIWSMIKYLLSARAGQIKKIKDIEHYKIKTAHIKSKKKVLFHTDAEIGGTTPVNIKVLPRQIKLIVP